MGPLVGKSWKTTIGSYITCRCLGCDKVFVPPGVCDCKVATKHDTAKVRMELLSPIALTEVAKVLTFGADKYEAHNWRKGFLWSRLLGATLRHLLAFIGGQDKDSETGLSHLAHASCCLMFLLEHEVTHKDKDDRYKAPELPGARTNEPGAQ